MKPDPVRAPWRRNLLYAAFVAGNPGDRSLQHRLVLKEVQMTPLPLPDVVNAASFGAAGRTGEPTAARETDVQLELLPLRIELGTATRSMGPKAPAPPGKAQYLASIEATRFALLPNHPEPTFAPQPTRNGDEPA